MNLVDPVRRFKDASPLEREAILLRNVFLGAILLTAFFGLMTTPFVLILLADHNLTLRQLGLAVVVAYLFAVVTGFARKKGLYGGPRL